MRWAQDAAVRGSDGKNRKLQIVGTNMIRQESLGYAGPVETTWTI
jgi:hypothetical protein